MALTLTTDERSELERRVRSLKIRAEDARRADPRYPTVRRFLSLRRRCFQARRPRPAMGGSLASARSVAARGTAPAGRQAGRPESAGATD